MSFFGDALFTSAAIIIVSVGIMLWVMRHATPHARAETLSAIFGLAAALCAMFAIGTGEMSEKLFTAPFLTMLALAILYGIVSWVLWRMASHNGSDLA